MPNEEYNFREQVDDILKTRWNALEALNAPKADEAEDNEELPLELDPENESIHDLRYSSEYLLEFIEGISEYFSENIDVSPYIHAHRIVLDNFERFGKLVADIDDVFGEKGFENDINLSELSKEEFEQRSELIRDAIVDYLSMLPRIDTWLHNIDLSNDMLYLMFLVVVITMIELEYNFISEFLD